MAKAFTSKEAKRLADQQGALLKRLEDESNIAEKCKDAICDAADRLMADEVMKVLRTVPIEEVNRDKRGIKTKALRDYGYKTLADIATASVYTIASVKGISQDAASIIRQIVKGYIDEVQKTIKIQLSVDKKTTANTRIVTAVYKYDYALDYGKTCRKLLSENKEKIEQWIDEVAPATSALRWMLTFGGAKQRTEAAYNNLRNQETYEQAAHQVLFEIEELENVPGTRAWEYFKKNPVKFFNILEDVVPGILGNDDAVYGLPEDLAREVQDEAFFPEGLLCDLRRYQEWGVKYILHQGRVLLGDEMGLGKTIQAIATMVSLKNTGATHFVVVCPASVITNWCREVSQKSKLQVTKIHGAGREQALASWIKTGGVAVTTYETTAYFKLDEAFDVSLIIVDEAHYIKNVRAQRSANVRKLCDHAKRLLFMTGTALENNVDEMISLIQVLRPDISSAIRGISFMSAAPQFREKIAPVYYRRKREDVLTELPELIEKQEWCGLSEKELEVYKQTLQTGSYPAVRQVSWNVGDVHGSSKAKRLQELVEEAKQDGRKVIVFSFFLHTIQCICELFENECMAPINGSVTPQKRQEIIDEFDDAPAGTILAAQIQSGGTGLNIQSASVVVICEPQFKPSIENQAISRAYRMGQTRNVLVYRLLCENTVDEKITDLLKRKQEVFDAFADKSVAAEKSVELDDKTFGNIIKEEIDRINAEEKAGNVAE